MATKDRPYTVNGERVTLEEYRKTRYDDLRVRVPKGKKETIQEFAKSRGKSLNSFVNEAIDKEMGVTSTADTCATEFLPI